LAPHQSAHSIPYGLSFLLTENPNAKVAGLEEFPQSDWPSVRLVHWSFDLMVAAGMAMLALAAWAGGLWWKRRPLANHPWLLRALVAAGPLGFVAIETGWIVTEVGRQPWIIYGVMRTDAAVTPMPGLVVPFVAFTVLYVFLAFVVFSVLRRQFLAPPATAAATPTA
jgi:cytochrome d ubiquinol oxidase subunit I